MSVTKQFIPLNASADFLGTGAIEINMYEREIFDVVRRTSVALNRLPTMRATGHPHRYFEQTAIASGAFTDPRNISPAVTSPTRVERTAYIKALVAQSNLSIFDKDVTQQQGVFAYVVGKDIEDIISGIEVTRAGALWTGNDTSMSSPTTTQYFGLLTQITQTSVIAPGASIVDGLKAQIAAMVANSTYVVRPSAIYMNPILADYLDREAKAAQITFGSAEVVAGVKVKTLSTQAGELPIISDPYIPSASGSAYNFSAPPAGNKNYFCAIIMEDEIEIPYISGEQDNPHPRLFQLGLTGNLAGQYVGIKFDAVLAKGPSYAHSIVAVQRP
jgi:hypothetical protein